jgi:hypothetical protein
MLKISQQLSANGESILYADTSTFPDPELVRETKRELQGIVDEQKTLEANLSAMGY